MWDIGAHVTVTVKKQEQNHSWIQKIKSPIKTDPFIFLTQWNTDHDAFMAQQRVWLASSTTSWQFKKLPTNTFYFLDYSGSTAPPSRVWGITFTAPQLLSWGMTTISCSQFLFFHLWNQQKPVRYLISPCYLFSLQASRASRFNVWKRALRDHGGFLLQFLDGI